MKETLTNRQIALMVFGAIVAYGIISLPKEIAEAAATGGWIPLLVTTVIAVAAGYMFTYLGFIHTEKTIYEYSILLTGKAIGNLLIFIYIIYFFSLFTMESRISCEIISLAILVKTPPSILVLVLLSVSFYGVTKKLKGIGIICELYGIIVIIFGLIINILILTQGNLINLRPFIPPLGITTYLKAIPKSIFALLIGVEVIALIPFHKKQNDKKVFWYVTLMITFIGFLYILAYESCISVLGVQNIIYYDDALLATIRRINIEPLEFLSRLDGLFIFAWIITIFTTVLIYTHATVFLLSKWFKKVSYNKLAFVVAASGFFISMLPRTMEDVKEIIRYIGYYSILTVIVIPLILIIITKVKKYDKKV